MNQAYPVFNNQFEVLEMKDESKTSKIYLARAIKDHTKLVFLKIYKEEYLRVNQKQVETEIQILLGLQHKHIVRIIEYASDGTVVKPSGKKIDNLVYTMLEHFTGQTLFEVCRSFGRLREDLGRRFLSQMIEVLSYMH